MPLTPKQFRQLALTFPEAEERSHMRHPDFRVAGKIFATLAYPDKSFAMVKLTPEQQAELTHDHPKIFTPVPGGWGRQGSTHIHLKFAKKTIVRQALEAAWRNTAPKILTATYKASNA
jgi:hypothetical protein